MVNKVKFKPTKIIQQVWEKPDGSTEIVACYKHVLRFA